MFKKASEDRRYSQYIVVPSVRNLYFIFAGALFLLLTFMPTAMAANQIVLTKLDFTEKLPLVGPKKFYLALGDSLAFSYQPNFDFDDGYADEFFSNLKNHKVKTLANLGCYGESSSTFINGGCPAPFLRKYAYVSTQLTAALVYLHMHPGQVSPVTLDIGANDVLPDINTMTCTVNSNFQLDLQTLDSNLTQTILPQLHTALMMKGQMTGDLVMMNYYDPFQNICPNTVPYVQLLNRHLANDVRRYGVIVNVFDAFGGSKTPNNLIDTYTWMCSIFNNYHPTNEGYSVIATTLENGIGY